MDSTLDPMALINLIINLFASDFTNKMNGQLTSIQNTISGVALVISLAVGALQCFFGYKLMKFWIALTGFVVGGVLGFVIGGYFSHDVGSGVIVGILGAILIAVLAVKLYYIGLFIFGGSLGFALSFLVTTQAFTNHQLYLTVVA